MPTEWLLPVSGLACLVWLAVLLRVRRFDPRLARCVEPTAAGYRARLNGWDRLAHMLFAAAVCLPIMFVVTWAPSWSCVPVDSRFNWLVAVLMIALSGLEPFTRFFYDDVTNNTLSVTGGLIPRDAVTGVELVDQTVRLMIGPEPVVVTRFRRPADAEALADWLRERLNVGAVVPPPRV